jgi:hypothetical protein
LKIEEQKAEEYLNSLGYKNIVYEHLGNKTPDFFIDDKIAVEVRRLNVNFSTGNIENFEYQLVNNIKNIIEKYECKNFLSSAYISLKLYEPKQLEEKNTIANRVNEILDNHVAFITEEKTYKVCDYLSVSFNPTSNKDTIYRYGGVASPCNWIVDSLYQNINLCIDDKVGKIEKNDFNFNSCSEWWLILVDYISYGMGNDDFEEILSLNIDKNKFSKVIILSYGKDSTIYEL